MQGAVQFFNDSKQFGTLPFSDRALTNGYVLLQSYSNVLDNQDSTGNVPPTITQDQFRQDAAGVEHPCLGIHQSNFPNYLHQMAEPSLTELYPNTRVQNDQLASQNAWNQQASQRVANPSEYGPIQQLPTVPIGNQSVPDQRMNAAYAQVPMQQQLDHGRVGSLPLEGGCHPGNQLPGYTDTGIVHTPTVSGSSSWAYGNAMQSGPLGYSLPFQQTNTGQYMPGQHSTNMQDHMQAPSLKDQAHQSSNLSMSWLPQDAGAPSPANGAANNKVGMSGMTQVPSRFSGPATDVQSVLGPNATGYSGVSVIHTVHSTNNVNVKQSEGSSDSRCVANQPIFCAPALAPTLAPPDSGINYFADGPAQRYGGSAVQLLGGAVVTSSSVEDQLQCNQTSAQALKQTNVVPVNYSRLYHGDAGNSGNAVDAMGGQITLNAGGGVTALATPTNKQPSTQLANNQPTGAPPNQKGTSANDCTGLEPVSGEEQSNEENRRVDRSERMNVYQRQYRSRLRARQVDLLESVSELTQQRHELSGVNSQYDQLKKQVDKLEAHLAQVQTELDWHQSMAKHKRKRRDDEQPQSQQANHASMAQSTGSAGDPTAQCGENSKVSAGQSSGCDQQKAPVVLITQVQSPEKLDQLVGQARQLFKEELILYKQWLKEQGLLQPVGSKQGNGDSSTVRNDPEGTNTVGQTWQTKLTSQGTVKGERGEIYPKRLAQAQVAVQAVIDAAYGALHFDQINLPDDIKQEICLTFRDSDDGGQAVSKDKQPATQRWGPMKDGGGLWFRGTWVTDSTGQQANDSAGNRSNDGTSEQLIKYHDSTQRLGGVTDIKSQGLHVQFVDKDAEYSSLLVDNVRSQQQVHTTFHMTVCALVMHLNRLGLADPSKVQFQSISSATMLDVSKWMNMVMQHCSTAKKAKGLDAWAMLKEPLVKTDRDVIQTGQDNLQCMVDSVKLSDGQVTQVLQAYKAYSETMSQLEKQRSQLDELFINVVLQTREYKPITENHKEILDAVLGSTSGSRSASIRVLDQLISEVELCMKEIIAVSHAFDNTILNILNPLQAAWMVVTYYPFHCCCVSIAHTVSQKFGAHSTKKAKFGSCAEEQQQNQMSGVDIQGNSSIRSA